MAEEKWKKRLVEQAIDREEIDGLIEPRVRSSAKYKMDERRIERDQPDLMPGMPAIVRVQDSRWRRKKGGMFQVEGYLQGIVLDWMRWDGYWDGNTDVIMQVVLVSQPELEPLVGRLITASIYRSYGSWARYRIVDFTSDFDRYTPHGKEDNDGH